MAVSVYLYGKSNKIIKLGVFGMRALETVAAIVCAVLVIFVLPYVLKSQETAHSLKLCAEEGVERLIADMTADGELTLWRVDELTQLLIDCGYPGEFQISVYTYEDAMDGTTHEFVVTWDEIVTILQEKNIYEFPENCYGKVAVEGSYPQGLLLRLMFTRERFERPLIIGKGV